MEDVGTHLLILNLSLNQITHPSLTTPTPSHHPHHHSTHTFTASTPSQHSHIHNTHTLTAPTHSQHPHPHSTHTSQCRYLVYPHCEGVPVRDKEPLPHIKLGVIDEQGTLNVLLDHPSEERGGNRWYRTVNFCL